MTSITDLRECIFNVYPLFLINIILAGFQGMLRGPIFALGLMRRLCIWNFVFQAIVMPIALYYFLFKVKYGMKGIWIAKIITEICLVVTYAYTIMSSNWYEIAYHFMRKRVRDSNLKAVEEVYIQDDEASTLK